MMERIKGLVVFGFFAVLVHDLHAQAPSVGSINCAPGTVNFDYPVGATGLPATTSLITNNITIQATGTVTLRLKNDGASVMTPAPTISLGNNAVAGAPTSWAAWGTTGCPVVSGTYSVVITAPNPGVGVMNPYYVVAGIDDGKNCLEDLFYGRIGAGSGTQNFGTAPANPSTTCGGGGAKGTGSSRPVVGPGAGNSPPNSKDKFKVFLNTGGRRLVIGQIQGNNFSSFGGLGTFNARNSLRDGNMLRLSYIPMIPKISTSSCCVSGLSGGSSGGSGRPAVIRTRVTRGSGRVSRRR